MKYHRLGRTGLYVSEICLGTMTWGGRGFWQVIGQLGGDDATGHLKRSIDAGVNFIDTADVYHEGLSETLLGEAIRKLGLRRQSLVLATKCRGRTGPTPNEVGLSRGHILDAVDASLTRLGVEHIDLYQIHGFDPVTPADEIAEALDSIVRAGKVRYVGFCNLAAWRVAKMLGIAENRGFHKLVSAQVYYTIASRDIEREIVPLAQEEGLAILPWSPLAGGLLTGKFSVGSPEPGARRTTFDFPPVDRDRAERCIEVMRAIALEKGVSVARIAISWLLHQSHVTSVIIGAKNLEQLDDNLAAPDVQLGSDDLARLDAVSALPQEYPAWMMAFQQRDRFS